MSPTIAPKPIMYVFQRIVPGGPLSDLLPMLRHMPNELAPRHGVDEPTSWPASEMVVHYSVAAPSEADARSVASALTQRGHRWVTVRPVYLPHLDPGNRLFGKPEFSRPELEGWWSVDSLVDEEAPDPTSEFHQHDCEKAAVEAIGRAHGGFWNGGSLANRETMLPRFDHQGLVHDIDQKHAHRIRRDVISSFPPPTEEPAPATPLQCTTIERPFPPVLECARQVARDQEAQQGNLPDGTAWWLTIEADGFSNDREVIFELADSVMHQGTCYPHTADEIPLLAGLACHEDIRPAHRAVFTTFLFEAATIGQRLAASGADRRVALGLPLEETADELAARHAVEAAAPYLLGRWDSEDEAVQFTLAALAAATQHSASSARIRHLAERWATGPRTNALRLAAALAETDAAEVATVLRSIVEGGVVRPNKAPSPLAPTRGAALNLLKPLVEREMSPLLAQ
ncbi:hypothetical protein OH809_14630 [Streptomyces sp. NBC_00873]|uniref:hypothetical protein n=1 Tax=unclassified Streptomyces TaxID=2593676 RepID=UPI00386F6500|nr:hypothetical protein OH809_14630 [Streptomyces sp. NBC_00873]WTA46175.1 hypothetical protein OH821_29055 [Streptomyces sp. NBC_00842]